MDWTEDQIWIETDGGESLAPYWWTIPPNQRMKWSIIQYSDTDFRVSLGQVGPNFEKHGQHYMGRGNTGGRDIWKAKSLEDAKAHVERQYADPG